MTTISLVMIVKNEAAVIGRCLDSVKGLVDEIIVVDTGSGDETKSISRSHGAKLFDFQWTDSFAEARNFALSQSSCEWSLVLDADEWVSNDCNEAIRQFIQGPQRIGRIKRINKFKGKSDDSYAQDFVSRLFPSILRYEGSIHEQIVTQLPREIVQIECRHDGYYDSSRSKRNIPLLEKELAHDADNAYLLYQLAKEYRGLEDYESAYTYLLNAYHHGQITDSFYPYIIVDLIYAAIECVKLKEVLDIVYLAKNLWLDFSDIHFVVGLYYLELISKYTEQYIHLLPEIELCYKKCLSIGENNLYDSVLGTGSYLANHNLGVFYEVTGNLQQAVDCYQRASNQMYQPSIDRLKSLSIG
jgi:glycosyltransferase involved in cell wall biosynthesis